MLNIQGLCTAVDWQRPFHPQTPHPQSKPQAPTLTKGTASMHAKNPANPVSIRSLWLANQGARMNTPMNRRQVGR